MSNHFTYKIDERNLRVQLKDLELPVSDEAWQRFDRFSGSQAVHHSGNSITRKINLNLNRAVVLPVVFGAIIVSFSFVLFNFISIKNPATESAHKSESLKTIPAVTAAPQKPAVQKTATTKPETVPSPEIQGTVPQQEFVVATQSAGMAGDKAEPMTISAPVNEQVPAVTVPAADNSAEVETAVNTETKTELPVKKKRRKQADPAADIRPAVVSDDQEADVRPN